MNSERREDFGFTETSTIKILFRNEGIPPLTLPVDSPVANFILRRVLRDASREMYRREMKRM
jgi:hypothetical protein